MLTGRASAFQTALAKGDDEIAAIRAATECLYPWQGGQDEEPVADDVVHPTPVGRSLSGAFERGSQIAVAWLGTFSEPLPVSPPLGDLERWCAMASGAEGRPEWWSIPLMPQVLTTSRAVGEGSLSVFAPEDDLGRSAARLYRCHTSDADRVYEVDSMESWRALIDRFPMDVTRSRRDIWGKGQRWFIPNWYDVASEFDIVHLTTTAYLELAGRVLAVEDGMTMVAGWGPDESVWLREATVDPASVKDLVRVKGEWRRANVSD